jgi:hypothetical protein
MSKLMASRSRTDLWAKLAILFSSTIIGITPKTPQTLLKYAPKIIITVPIKTLRILSIFQYFFSS